MKIVYLPLDERPCNRLFAPRIARGTDVEVIGAPKEILGDKKTAADYRKIREFLLDNADRADAFVISLDMLLYGGIVPSRLHHLSENELSGRLSVLDEIKSINSMAKIYAFALITRCPSYSSADEEPDYYEYCGREIFLSGQVKHKMMLGLIDKEEGERILAEYSEKIGDNLKDFEERRAVNRAMLLKAVDRLDKSIDFIILPQDDSAPYGYTTIDREILKKEFLRSGKDIAMYPGADEVGMTLLARAVVEHYNKVPKIHFEYPKPECENVIPLYEDRPIKDTLPYQVRSAGCEFSDKGNADILLYLNYPTKEPKNVGEELSPGYAEREMDAFCDKIAASVKEGLLVGVADCSLCNGGEIEFLKALTDRIDYFDLAAYAGWNTSSNTLGTVICESVFAYIFGKREENENFLADRVYEDVGYCGYVRKFVADNILPSMGFDYFNAGEEDGEVAKIVRLTLEDYISKNLPCIAARYKIDVCKMPWKRMFEVDLSTKPHR